MVLAPYFFLPAFILRFTAFCMASKSKPWCMRNRWSSLAITATGISGLISSSVTHLWCILGISPSLICCAARMNISGVNHTGITFRATTASRVEAKNATTIHFITLPIREKANLIVL